MAQLLDTLSTFVLGIVIVATTVTVCWVTGTRPASHREPLLWGLRLSHAPLEQRIQELHGRAWNALGWQTLQIAGFTTVLIAAVALLMATGNHAWFAFAPALLVFTLFWAFIFAGTTLCGAVYMYARYRGARLRLEQDMI